MVRTVCAARAVDLANMVIVCCGHGRIIIRSYSAMHICFDSLCIAAHIVVQLLSLHLAKVGQCLLHFCGDVYHRAQSFLAHSFQPVQNLCLQHAI